MSDEFRLGDRQESLYAHVTIGHHRQGNSVRFKPSGNAEVEP
jgi:hypothetical protein